MCFQGPVRLRGNSRRASVSIKQIQGNDSVCVGEYSGVTRTLHLEKCNDVVWDSPRGRPPKDRTIKEIKHFKLSLPLFLAIVIVAGLGILLATSFLIFNVVYRNQR